MNFDDWFCIGIIVVVFGMLAIIANPNSESNIKFREFEKDCRDKGGTVVYTKESARNVKWFCAKEAT